MIVLIGGEKGGTGKTTVTTNLAALRAMAGYDVLIVDTDTQRSASYWTAARSNNADAVRVHCISLYEPNLGTQVPDLANRYSDIIIDAGGRDSPELRRSMLLADKAFIPVQPSQFDIWTVPTLEGQIKQAKMYNPKLEAFLLLSRAHSHRSSKELEEVREALADKPDLPLAQSVIRDRAIFRRASAAGLSVVEINPSDGKAIEEVKALYEEVFGNG